MMFLVCGAAAIAPAAADISGGVGGFTQSGNGSSSTGGAIFLSTGRALPVVPVSVDLTGLGALTRNGGYAITLEGRAGAAGFYGGAGVGFGQFGGAPTSGMFTAFLGAQVLPFTSLELRGYKSSGNSSETGALLGLRFTI